MDLRDKLKFWIMLSNYVDMIVRGTSPLSLPDAIANSLSYVKAFGGTEQRNLPNGYTELEYIESTGAQYIDTGIKGNMGVKADLDSSVSSATSVNYFLAARKVAGQATRFYACTVSGVFDLALGEDSLGSEAVIQNRRYNFVMDTTVSPATLVIDGGTTITNGHSYNTELNMYLFAANIAGVASFGGATPIRIYYAKIWEGNTLVRDFVPARRNSDNVLGMYDTVSGQFLTNQGTGDFVAGDPVVPTPTAPIPITCNNGVLKLSPNLVEFNETRISNTTWPTANKTKGFEVNADVYNKSVGDQLFTNANCFGVFVPAKINESVSLNFFDYSPDYSRCYYCEVTADGKCNTAPVSFASGGAISQKTFTLTQADSIGFVVEWYISAQQTRNYTKENYMIVRGISVPTAYIPYGQIYTDGTVETINVHGKNLFDKATISKYTLLNTSTGETIPQQEEWSWCSDFIPVDSNATYYFKSGTNWSVRIFEYAGDKSYLSRNYTARDSSFTVGSTCEFIRFHIGHNAGGQAMYEGETMVSLGSTATDYVPYYDGGTSTAEMLLKVGDYQDVQSIIDGVVTRNVGIKVFDGTENWSVAHAATYTYTINISDAAGQSSWSNLGGLCSHLSWYVSNTTPSYTNTNPNTLWFNSSRDLRVKTNSNFATLTDWTNYLKAQYAAGTPVIVIYPLATATTESVTGQALQVQEGNNILEITQASLNNLELEVKYKKQA